MLTLRQRLNTFFTTPLLHQHVATTTLFENPMNSSVESMDTSHSLPPLKRLHTGSPKSCALPSQQLPAVTSMPYAHSISNPASPPPSLKTLELTLSSGVVNAFSAKASKDCGSSSRLQFSSELSTKLGMTKKESMSNRRSVWHLPPSYDLENL